jgi:hypothetical protein
MSPSAVTMMIIALVVVGGGLVASIVALMNHPEEPED